MTITDIREWMETAGTNAVEELAAELGAALAGNTKAVNAAVKALKEASKPKEVVP